MKIKSARHIGYCFGVRRAMDLAFKCLESHSGPVYSHGPMIHNCRAMEILTKKGLKQWPENYNSQDSGHQESPATVIIRAHGLSPKAESALRGCGVDVVDATCPRVAVVQRRVAKEAADGSDIIIWGAAGHPEVEGLLGYAANHGHVISGHDEVAALPELKRVVLVAQTTQNLELWDAVAAAVTARWPLAKCLNTVCQATANRQAEAKRLSEECPALVVVGDRHSSNTRKLYEIGQARGLRTISVEGPEEIPSSFVEGVDTVGLLAGASTPVWQVRLVHQRLLALARSRENDLPAFLRRFLRALVLSNIFVGLGSGCLGLAMAAVAGYQVPDYFFGLFFFFVQTMHCINGYLDLNAARYNDLDRVDFLTKYRPYLHSLGLASFVLSLSAAYLAGSRVLGLLLLLSISSIIYAVPLLGRPLDRWGVRRLKDIPLSKSFCTAVGWATLLTIPGLLSQPPLVEATAENLQILGVTFTAVFFQVFCRSIRMDYQASLGDRVFGPWTTVTFMGWKWANRFLVLLLMVWSLFLAGAWLYFPERPLIWLLLAGPLLNFFLLPGFIKKERLDGFLFDMAIDSQFLLSGLTVWLWTILS
ncbi:MAG: 4-hydroxy-3-methylbut-2-enyl diphosphate reductase [Deltaproteobacteria bacterium]|jgi:4-hydroxy-3-methylbut-2-enyl diphosphate reductase|nr:4-hydroxy-3-methylbut-2-enyl diphosphate reductase [Deltaproteobacteria bacterium]